MATKTYRVDITVPAEQDEMTVLFDIDCALSEAGFEVFTTVDVFEDEDDDIEYINR